MSSPFDKFTQVDGASNRKYGGTGLGLAISKHLVELMGGSIGFKSTVNKGSLFWLNVPLTKVTEGTQTLIIPDAMNHPRILVVDANAAQRQLLSKQLRSLGFLPQALSNSEDALATLQQSSAQNQTFAAILYGENLTQHQKDFAKSVRASMPLAPHIIPMLYMRKQGATVNDTISFTEQLVKPIRPRTLYQTLISLFDAPAQRHTGTISAARRAIARLNDGPQVLLVEDNMVNQKVALGMLKKMGIAADTATNGIQALKRLLDKPYQLVLMDIQMPEMDGLTATRHIRDRTSSYPHDIPIIAMTANAMAGDREACLEAGMNDYISKPVNPDVLENLLVDWLMLSKPGAPE